MRAFGSRLEPCLCVCVGGLRMRACGCLSAGCCPSFSLFPLLSALGAVCGVYGVYSVRGLVSRECPPSEPECGVQAVSETVVLSRRGWVVRDAVYVRGGCRERRARACRCLIK